MIRYYFYKPQDARDIMRGRGVIGFELDALYADTAYSIAKQRDVRQFHFFDQIRALVATKKVGMYDFDVQTGVDSFTGHWAKGEKELLSAYGERGWQLVTEKQYQRLRKLAVNLLFKHTESFAMPAQGEQRYSWSNQTYHAFWNIHLTSLNYQYNSKEHDAKFLSYLQDNGLPLNDVSVPEKIKVFIAKPKDGQKRYLCYNFKISCRETNCRYNTFDEAHRSLANRDEPYQHLTALQYLRIRKFCKWLMLNFHHLDITPLLKKQDYAVTLLDQFN